MNVMSVAVAEQRIDWDRPGRGRVGMFSLIGAESAIFTIFIVAYLFYVGKSLTGPTPKDGKFVREHEDLHVFEVV